MSAIKLKTQSGGSVEVKVHDTTVDYVTYLISQVGVMFDFAGVTAPKGSVSCDGQELDKTTYPALYAIIGDTWNTTNGVTTATGKFRVPPQQVGNLGLYTRGVGTTNGVVGTYQEDVIKKHNHTMQADLNSAAGGAGFNPANVSATKYPGIIYDEDNDDIETRPRSITVLKCIWV